MQIGITRRRLSAGLASALAAPALMREAWASEGFPARPIRIVVASAPGGASDTTTRLVAQKMSENIGQSVIVENRPGGDSLLGTRFVRDAAPDGYTLLSLSSGVTARPALYNDPGYELLRDFTGVGPMIRLPLVLIVGAGQPDRTLADFVARAKAQPGRLAFASGGVGVPPYLAAIKLLQAAALNLLHVPYRGNGAAVADVVAGRVDMIFEGPGLAAGYVRAGQARALAVTSGTRLPSMPEVPTMAEAGFPGATFSLWLGLVAPAATPPAILDRLSTSLHQALGARQLRERFLSEGAEPMLQSPAAFTAMMHEDMAQMRTIAAELGLAKQ